MANSNSFKKATNAAKQAAETTKAAGFKKAEKAVVDFAAEFGNRGIVVEKPGMEK